MIHPSNPLSATRSAESSESFESSESTEAANSTPSPSPSSSVPDCPLCDAAGGVVLWSNASLRVISVDDAHYPGFTRVVWQAHVAEMTDLSPTDRDVMMRAVYCVEQAQRTHLAIDKINLAAFGNMVPHLHWHVIPRWKNDRHFPDAYWASPRLETNEVRAADDAEMSERHARVAPYQRALIAALDALD